MNQSALKYRAYKALLELDLSDTQRNKLIEANIFQKIADFFGAGTDTLTTDLKKIFKNNNLNRRAASAKKNIEKEIDELKSIAKDAGVSEEAVYDMLNLTLKSKNVSPAEVASPPKIDQGSAKDSTTPGIPSGKPVDDKNPESISTLVRAAAQAAGQDPEKASEQAEEKKVDVPKATQVLAKAISSVSKVDAGKVSKIIDFLIKNNHMIAEGQKNISSSNIQNASKELKNRWNNKITLERWNVMSGVGKILFESKEEAKKKFSNVTDEVRKSFKPEELSDEDILGVLMALDDLDSIQIK